MLQVLALFGFYDVDRDGGLSYYEFIDKVLESDWGEGEREKVVLAVQLDDDDVEMKSRLRPEEVTIESLLMSALNPQMQRLSVHKYRVRCCLSNLAALLCSLSGKSLPIDKLVGYI